MLVGKRFSGLLIGLLLVWAVLASSMAAYYYFEYSSMKRLYESLSNAVIIVNIGIDYGNGTIRWFNNSLFPAGSTVLSALTTLCKVEYTYGDYGAYIIAIDGVKENIISKNEGYSWMWFLYNASSGRLDYGPVAADKYIISNGDTILWRYVHWKF